MKVIKKQTNSHDCIVCGIDNPYGLHANFYEMEDGSLVSLFQYHFNHQSYPERTHGGMIAAMIDESIGRAIWTKEPDTWACTIKLNIEYHAAMPYDVPLMCIATLDENSSLTFRGSARIIDRATGKLLAKGSALYFKLPLSKISPNTADKEWHPDDINVPCPDDVTEIDIPEQSI
jgi:acyl-coenzyme A thioesterase PaaI-like protein